MTDHRPLTSNVRNSVLKIPRLTDLASFYHVCSEFNLADLGTKPGTLEDVDPKSTWFSGHQWMKEQPEDWPVTQASDLSISNMTELRQVQLRLQHSDNFRQEVRQQW